jgi:hypothetical protein
MTTRVLWGVAVALALFVAVALVLFGARLDTVAGNPYAPTPVLVANRIIPAWTPGTVVADREMYIAATLLKKEILEGAIADPTFLTGRTTAVDVLPGKQLTDTDFALYRP